MWLEEFTSKDQMERSSRWVLGLVSALLLLGLVMVYSARTVKVSRLGGAPMEPLFQHAVKVGLGLFAMLLLMRMDYRALGRHYGKVLILILLILILVLIPGLGARINGARRWFLVLGIMVQPSEFAKLGMIVVISSLVVKSGDHIQRFDRGLLPSLAIVTAVCLLILNEPDFGTTVIMGCLAVTLLVIGGVRIQHFTVLFATIAPLLFFYAYNKLGHVGARLKAFLEPAESGQAWFSIMAIASGGCLGAGLGGSQCKLNFIPECESDFIFAIIGEEMGFWGASLVILLFMALIYHGIRILLGIRNRFGFMMASGIVLLIATQALVNLAVVLGMAPTKGLPLPFISSGGSSLIALLMAVGILLSIARNPDLASEPIKDEFCETCFSRWIKPFETCFNGRDS